MRGGYDEGLSSMPLSAEHLFKRFRLQRLLGCDMLETVVLEYAGYYSGAAIEAAKGLGDLLKRGFAEKTRPQAVEVEVEYTRQPRRPRFGTPYDY